MVRAANGAPPIRSSSPTSNAAKRRCHSRATAVTTRASRTAGRPDAAPLESAALEKPGLAAGCDDVAADAACFLDRRDVGAHEQLAPIGLPGKLRDEIRGVARVGD